MLKTLISRPIGIGMSLLASLLLGIIAYQSISLQLFPDGFDPPFFWVSIPTLSATIGENEITIAEKLRGNAWKETRLAKAFFLESNNAFRGG